jgi:DNA repair exonuclease SbcCD ATPase subunit
MADDQTLTAEQVEQLKADLAKERSDKEFQIAEAKKAFEKRDEFKKQLEAIEKEKLESTNQFQDLYKKEQERSSTLEKQLEELNPFKDKWTSYETARRETLLKEIEDADLKEVGAKMELLDLEKFATKIKKPVLPTDGGRGGGSFDYDGKKWDELSSDDKEKLSKDKPDIYKKLYYEKYRRNPEI